MNLDKKYLVLLQRLTENSRISLTELKNELKISKNSISKRIQALYNENIIKKNILILDYNKLGYKQYNLFLKTNFFYSNKDFVEKLPLSNIIEIVGLFGEVGLSIKFIAKCEDEKNLVVSDILKNISFSSYELVESFRYDFNPAKKYIDEQKQIKNSKTKDVCQMDDLDYLIIKELAHNSSRSIIEIANLLNKNSQLISYRLKKLNEANVILSNYTLTNLSEFNFQTYLLFIKTNDKLSINKLFSYLIGHKLVNEVSIFNSYRDIMSYFISRDLNEVSNFINEINGQFLNSNLNFELLVGHSEFYFNSFPECILKVN